MKLEKSDRLVLELEARIREVSEIAKAQGRLHGVCSAMTLLIVSAGKKIEASSKKIEGMRDVERMNALLMTAFDKTKADYDVMKAERHVLLEASERAERLNLYDNSFHSL